MSGDWSLVSLRKVDLTHFVAGGAMICPVDSCFAGIP